ncbi:MAG: hypothetical protein ACXIVQ_12785 [Acidimicrobiales bacterium]
MQRRGVRHRVGGALLSWVLVAVVVRVVVALPEQCPVVTRDQVWSASEQAVAWLERNQNDDGTWLYRYDRENDVEVDDYNTVRHAGVVMSLYQADRFGIDGALEVADAGTEFALANLVTHDDWIAFEPSSNRVTTGAAALLVAGMVERRMATGDDRYDEQMAALSRFLLVHVEESGAVIESWDRANERPLAGVYSPFFTGEVFWALSLMHLSFPDDGWDEPADRIGRYIATQRDEAEGYFPDLPDHWAAYGLSTVVMWPERAEQRPRPLTDDEASYAARQTGFGGIQARWESQRVDDWPRYALRGRRTLGAGLGTVGEHLTSLWVLTVEDERLAHLEATVADRSLCVAGMLIDRQVGEVEAESFADPGRTRGAWFQFGFTQMDDQQHALSALLLTLPIIDAQEDET